MCLFKSCKAIYSNKLRFILLQIINRISTKINLYESNSFCFNVCFKFNLCSKNKAKYISI